MGTILHEIETGAAFAESALACLPLYQLDAVELHLHRDQSLALNYHPLTRTSVESSGEWLRATIRAWKKGRCGLAGGAVRNAADLEPLLMLARRYAESGRFVPFPHNTVSALPPAREAGGLSRDRLRQHASAIVEALSCPGIHLQAVLLKQFDSWSVIVNTEGLMAAYYQPTEQTLVSCATPQGAIIEALAAQRLEGDWTPAPLQARIAAAAEVLQFPGKPPDPHLPYVLRPVVAAPLVAGLGWFLRGDTALSQPGIARSLGKKLFPAVLNVSDDPVHPAGMNKRMVDDEGRQALPVRLIDAGRILSFVHSTESAYHLRAQPNGHALRFSAAEHTIPWPFNLHILPGPGSLPDSYNELVARIDTQKTIPPSSLISLRVAGWEVRNSQRTRPIGPFDLHLPLLQTFRCLQSVCSDLTFIPTADGCGSPTLVFTPLLGKVSA